MHFQLAQPRLFLLTNGAQLIVRASQCAQFVYLGHFGDAFGPGKHRLTTDNIPILNVTVDEFVEAMRSRLVGAFSDAVAAVRVPVLQIASRYREIGDALLPVINPIIAKKYGLEVTTFVVENVSVPVEVEQAIDKRSSMAAIGDLNEHVKYQMAHGLDKGGSAAGTAAELALCMSMAQQLTQGRGGFAAPEFLTPADVALRLGVSEADVLAVIESGELAVKKIGSSYRVKPSELDTYLKR